MQILHKNGTLDLNVFISKMYSFKDSLPTPLRELSSGLSEKPYEPPILQIFNVLTIEDLNLACMTMPKFKRMKKNREGYIADTIGIGDVGHLSYDDLEERGWTLSNKPDKTAWKSQKNIKMS